MVTLAVPHAPNRDLEQLKSTLEKLENCHNDRDCFSKADDQFHLSLASASHNRLIYWFYKKKLSEVRSHAHWGGMKELIINPENIKAYNTQHRALYTALVNRDMERVKKLMIEHLEKARQDIINVRST